MTKNKLTKMVTFLIAMFALTFAVAAAPANMVTNGEFSNGLTSWTTYVEEGVNANVYASLYDDLRADVWQESDENWKVQAYQAGLYLERGRTYTLTFEASTIGKVVNGTVDVSVQKNGGNYDAYMVEQTVALNPGTNNFSFTFTMMAETDNDARVSFNFGKNGQDGPYFPTIIRIDGVSLTTGPNMIVNCQFKDGMNGWESYIDANANADIYVSEQYESLRAYVAEEAPENWHVQVFQAGLNLKQGKTYELKFYATTLGEQTYGNIDVSIQENGNDYTAYMETETVEVNPGVNLYTYTFTMNEQTDADARVSFNFGKNGPAGYGPASHISVDNVVLIEK